MGLTLPQWKRNWKLFHSILDHSGFSINHETGCILAGDDAWDRLIAQNKDVKLFRNRPLLYREELNGIFSGTVATGEFSQLLAESMFDDLGLNSQATSQVEDEEEETQEEYGQSNQAVSDDFQSQDSLLDDIPISIETTTTRIPTKRAAPATTRAKSKKRRGDTLTESVQNIADEYRQERLRATAPTPRATAMKTLDQGYGSLDAEEFRRATQLLENDVNVEFFNSMSRKRRDEWLTIELGLTGNRFEAK
jgi:hypothetical protein